VDRLLDGASFLLGVPKESISLENGRAHMKDGPSRTVSYADIAAVLLKNDGQVIVEGAFDWPTADKGIPGAFGLPHYIHSYMSQIVLVEVDTMTGRVEVLKTVSIPDAGRVINPLGLEGQTEGGAVMGAGYALTEDTVIENGQFKTKNLSTYIIPTSLDIPEIETVMVEELEESGPYGAKGIGEAVSIPITPAIANAIEDAVGVRLYEIPMTPERVYWAIHGKR
jgi:CO/xanthine dehydrogenase Mo-binding subunit